MGVRYNAEKKKIGMYYSTPIFSFRCKCHLCSGWFEIQTDPQVRLTLLALTHSVNFTPLTQNTRYVVVSGARRKEEDWDPAENGGFAVHGPSRKP
jgi:coiled-coil domain-containing protein 130